MQLSDTKPTSTPMLAGHGLSKTQGILLANAIKYHAIISALQY